MINSCDNYLDTYRWWWRRATAYRAVRVFGGVGAHDAADFCVDHSVQRFEGVDLAILSVRL